MSQHIILVHNYTRDISLLSFYIQTHTGPFYWDESIVKLTLNLTHRYLGVLVKSLPRYTSLKLYLMKVSHVAADQVKYNVRPKARQAIL